MMDKETFKLAVEYLEVINRAELVLLELLEPSDFTVKIMSHRISEEFEFPPHAENFMRGALKIFIKTLIGESKKQLKKMQASGYSISSLVP